MKITIGKDVTIVTQDENPVRNEPAIVEVRYKKGKKILIARLKAALESKQFGVDESFRDAIEFRKTKDEIE